MTLKWRTVSSATGAQKSHRSQPAAYAWIAARPEGDRFRVQVLESEHIGWQLYAAVVSRGDGTTDEVL